MNKSTGTRNLKKKGAYIDRLTNHVWQLPATLVLGTEIRIRGLRQEPGALARNYGRRKAIKSVSRWFG